MVKLADIDVQEEAEKMTPKALELAKELGHAAAVCRRGTNFFVCDSWQAVESATVVRLVSASGSVVRL